MPIVRLESAIFRLLDACLIEECLIIDEFLLKERFEPMISVAARITAPVACHCGTVEKAVWPGIEPTIDWMQPILSQKSY